MWLSCGSCAFLCLCACVLLLAGQVLMSDDLEQVAHAMFDGKVRVVLQLQSLLG